MVLILRTPNFLDENGNRVLIGWMGLPEINYPTDEEGWAHCLTIPRVLSIENNQLRQRPFKGLERLRKNKETALGYANKFNRKLHPYEGKQYELIIDVIENDASKFILNYVPQSKITPKLYIIQGIKNYIGIAQKVDYCLKMFKI